MASVISMTDVTWRRDSDVILQGVTWTVHPGEHWALIGENGAGKSTLLEMVSGFIWPTSGSVEVLGERFGEARLPDLRRRIGWVTTGLVERFSTDRPQDTSAEVVASGRYASIGLWKGGQAEDLERAAELMEAFGARHLAERPFRLLSQGERQRVLIARAWMADPELLILDEPCTGLDLRAREQLLKTIESLATRPGCPTLIYVTHHVEEVLPLFTHALLLKDGRTFVAGLKRDVLRDDLLSEVFGVPLEVTWSHGRPWVRVDL